MVLAGCLGGMLTSQVAAGADPVPQRQDACPDSGTALRYIVLFDRGTAEQAATDEITAAVSTVDRTAEQWDMAQIHAPAARAINPGSPDVLVGVLDSGIDPNHPDLRPALDEEHSAGCLTGKPDTTQEAWAPTTSAHG